MFVLTKRWLGKDQDLYHKIHGITPNISVARAWFRSTRVTDVFELVPRQVNRYYGEGYGHEQSAEDIISSEKLESWREQHARESLEAAKQRQADGVI